MQEWSSSLSSTRGGSIFLSSKGEKHQNVKNNHFQCEWRRHSIPCGSTQGAPSLVPTSSEVCIGSNIREGGHYRRIGILKRRIEAALDGMEVLLRRRPKEPDGEEELERRRTRSIEFLSRFSRNYLFQLRMQVMELKRQMQCSSLASPGRYTHHQLLLKKLVAAHQTAVQGLQACLNQLPGSAHDSAILSKLDQLLCYLCELTSLKTQIDLNARFVGSEGSPRQDTTKTKAQNLVEIVRKKRKEREEAYDAWRETAAILAKKRFGISSTAKAKSVFRPITQQERKSSSKADRRSKKQRPAKKVMDLQAGGNEIPLHHFRNIDQPEQKIDGDADPPLDPATALELKIIMSRMKDILRGAHVKPSPPPKPMFPPNVRLICITHEEDLPNEDKSPGRTGEKELSEDVLERNDSNDKLQLETCTINHEQTLPINPTSQQILQPAISSDPAEELELRPLPSRTRLQRRLTPEEQRIIDYRNQFRSYKQRVREIQQTSEELLSTVFREVANELEPSILLDKMYHLELQG